MKKIICSKCGGSDNISSEKKMIRLPVPENVRILLLFSLIPYRALISYGRVYFSHKCECGNTWEEDSHL
jgi:hypothetical protein